jgi:hypothetical protein
MVVWCKTCGALLGIREPVYNWSTDRNGVCAPCLEKKIAMAHPDSEKQNGENTPEENTPVHRIDPVNNPA